MKSERRGTLAYTPLSLHAKQLHYPHKNDNDNVEEASSGRIVIR